jgi:hypothetical protein
MISHLCSNLSAPIRRAIVFSHHLHFQVILLFDRSHKPQAGETELCYSDESPRSLSLLRNKRCSLSEFRTRMNLWMIFIVFFRQFPSVLTACHIRRLKSHEMFSPLDVQNKLPDATIKRLIVYKWWSVPYDWRKSATFLVFRNYKFRVSPGLWAGIRWDDRNPRSALQPWPIKWTPLVLCSREEWRNSLISMTIETPEEEFRACREKGDFCRWSDQDICVMERLRSGLTGTLR